MGECGNLAHDFTIDQYQEKQGRKPQCPICKTVIGHTGYGNAYNLERLDPEPVVKANKDQLKVVDPGYQRERPGQGEKVRTHGGLALRFGRFYSLALILFYEHYVKGDKEEEGKEGEPRAIHTNEVLGDLEFEWKLLQEMSGSSEEEVMVLIWEMVQRYMDDLGGAETFDRRRMSRKKEEADQAKLNREEFEQKFVEICVPA